MRLEDADLRYMFPFTEDALTFQSAVRDKHLQGIFQVEKITAERNRQGTIVSQVLKLWTDFTGANGSLSIFRRGGHRGLSLLQFQLTDFAYPFGTKDGSEPSIRLKFNRVPKPVHSIGENSTKDTKASKRKSRSSRGSIIFKKRFSSASSINSTDSNAVPGPLRLLFPILPSVRHSYQVDRYFAS